MADRITKRLTQDVIVHILIRLAVKPLMRLKCVSKSCYTLIKSSTFLNLHIHRKTTSKDELILFKRSFKQNTGQYTTILSFLSGDDDDYLNSIFPDLDVTHLTSIHHYNNDQLVGPCHGLIALMDSHITILFNPSTRIYKLLPPNPFGCQKGFFDSTEAVGFGFDSIANDYKVVRISIIYIVNDGYPDEHERKVQIYNLSNDYWREIDHAGQQLTTFFIDQCSQMFYKGTCHWIASQDIDAFLVLCFDMSTEIFRSFKIPETCHYSDGPCCRLVLLHDSLTLIYYPYPEPVIPLEKEMLNVWVMRDYSTYESWIKKYTITGLPIETPLAVWKNCLLLFQNRSGCLMSYNLESNEVKELNYHGYPQSLRVAVYKDSLASIPRETEQVHKF
uniref:S11-locus linked F-box protein 1 n=1 Tax=Petunia hybrida TaxID=4102 RepID=A0A140JNM5_PETHY|nr:S11-locus linked F-box protein 1 [Petunia x hybrida]